ncbi:iron(III) transport system ATP-binding protein [Bowdeniella nasicola]|uniref:Spermidine/putrescine import ATP-binding protein PotA n=1 Tax=Bowdeniella nasicola TaxID=208480 RepID=A0A1H4E0J5_9ACTO|nr:ABC transporter ATP-binding protein [Bowdeniella nasicola]SEA77942.1 iron(III) transport system ATP-binding protein [Bowdeniella nasicola]
MTAHTDTIEEFEQTEETGRLKLDVLRKTFGSGDSAVHAVDGISLDINPGEFVTLLGPSGCGKTTTLRMVAGFEDATSGRVELDGVNLVDQPPNKRPMAMVFQSYALFPHLSVRDNIAYGLKLKKLPAEEIKEQVDLALTSMNLNALADRAPNQLSGGQQQRVALARAMVMRPKVLLFDEPLSNLDAKLRVRMRQEIRRLQHRLGITSLYVTHDQAEAMSLSDRIVVMNAGKIEQAASPDEIYRRPASEFVADFIGRANFLSAEVLHKAGDSATVKVLEREFTIPAHPDVEVGRPALVLVRPESVRLEKVAANGSTNNVVGDHGQVLAAVFYGENVEYEVETEHGTIVVIESDPDPAQIHEEGSEVRVDFNSERSWLLPSQG